MRTTGLRGANPNILLSWFFFTKILPMLISGGAIYLGYKLFILGVTGQASLSIESKTISGQLVNAAPGLFFAVGGFATLIVSIIKGLSIDMGGDDSDGTGLGVLGQMSLKAEQVVGIERLRASK